MWYFRQCIVFFVRLQWSQICNRSAIYRQLATCWQWVSPMAYNNSSTVLKFDSLSGWNRCARTKNVFSVSSRVVGEYWKRAFEFSVWTKLIWFGIDCLDEYWFEGGVSDWTGELGLHDLGDDRYIPNAINRLMNP